MSTVPDSLFTELGPGSFLPTEASRGPWSRHALHGGPVGALVARSAELALAATGSPAIAPVRMTLDLERPVPLAPLRVTAEVVRGGRKVQVAEVAVFDEDDRRLARGTVLALRRQPTDLPPEYVAPPDVPIPPLDHVVDGPMWEPMPGITAFHKDGVEHRFVRGGILTFGPAADWIRLAVPVLPGEPPSPFQRTAAASDFVNGISSTLPHDRWTFINPDLTVTLHRLPVGEWIGLDAVTRLDDTGVGTAEADLFDAHGRIGRCGQTLLVEPVGGT